MEQQRVKLNSVKEFLDKSLAFLEPYLLIASAHASEFITKHQWERLVPGSIREELAACTDEELKKFPMLGCHQRNIQRKHQSETEADSQFMTVNSDVLVETIVKNKKDAEVFIGHVGSETKLKGTLGHRSLMDNYMDNKVEMRLEDPDIKTVEIDAKDSPADHAAENSGSSFKVQSETDKRTTSCMAGQNLKWKHTNLREFCQDACNCTMDKQGLAVTVGEMFEQLGIACGDSNLFIPNYMNEKKSYEVDIMSEVCSQLLKSTQCQLVVDIGSGKGYLGQTLYLQQKLTVLGIDAESSNTTAAEKRISIVGTQWEGLNRYLENQKNQVKLTRKQKKQMKIKEKSRTTLEEDKASENQMDCARTESYVNRNVSNSTSIDFDEEKCLENGIRGLGGCYIPLTMFVDTTTDLKAIAVELFPFLSANKDAKQFKNKTNKDCTEICYNSVHVQRYLNANTDQIGEMEPEKKSVLHELADVTRESEDLSESVSYSSHSSYPLAIETGASRSTTSQDCCEKSDIHLMLTGLHTCGDLASSILELFVSNFDVKCLCSVGCCYHLLTEEFFKEGQKTDETHHSSGFPMSAYLKRKNVCLGNTARNLASQSIYRMVESDEGYRFYPRALLQKIIVDLVDPESVKWTGLRRLEQRTASISDYIRKAWKKLELPEDLITEELIQSYTEQYEHQRRQLAAFFQLRAVLAPCIESLILLDRICFLLEHDMAKDVFLVKMFDPYISPRCYGIVATKR